MATIFDLGAPIQVEVILAALQIIVTLALTYIAVRIFRVVVRRLGGEIPGGLVASVQQIGSWAIWAIGIIIVLSQFAINTNILLLILAKQGIDLKKLEGKLIEVGQELKVDLVPDSTPQVRVSEVSGDTIHLVLMLQVANPAKRDQLISDVQKRVYDVLPQLTARE